MHEHLQHLAQPNDRFAVEHKRRACIRQTEHSSANIECLVYSVVFVTENGEL